MHALSLNCRDALPWFGWTSCRDGNLHFNLERQSHLNLTHMVLNQWGIKNTHERPLGQRTSTKEVEKWMVLFTS